MESEREKRLSNNSCVVILGVLAAVATITSACVGIFIFITGKQYLQDILNFGPETADVWKHKAAQIPATGTQVTWDLNQGEVLVLTGGRVRLGDFYCGDDKSQICVVIIQATKRHGVAIGELVAQNNWLGVTDVFNPEEALSDVQPGFWRDPNCGNGCSKATIGFFTDDQFVGTRTILAP